MSKTIDDLRATLFETLAAVKDGSLDLDKARAVNSIAQTIIDTAKVEVDYLRLAGGESKFIETTEEPETPALPSGVTGITRHMLR